MTDDRSANRKNAIARTGVGTGMLVAGAAGNEVLDHRLRSRGGRPLLSAIAARARKREGGFTLATHGPHLAGKAAVRGVQVAAIPMVVAGARGILHNEETKPVHWREDVAEPLVRGAVYQNDPAHRITKYLSDIDAARLDRHRKAGRAISLTSGTLGLGALALRSPQAAKGVMRLGVKGKGVARLSEMEPHATRLSNTLGIGAIGIGSAGSFNYAAQQRLERKKDVVSKIAPRIVYHGTSRARSGLIAAEGIKPGTGGHFGPAVYTSEDPGQAAKWGAFKAQRDNDGRRVRRHRFMAVGPARELRESKILAYRPEQLIPDGNPLGTKVRAGGQWDRIWPREKSARPGSVGRSPLVVKSLPKYMFHAGKNRRVLGYDKLRGQILLENPGYENAPYRVSRGGQKPPKDVAPQAKRGEQLELDFGKSYVALGQMKKSFLSEHADRISPEAERGYRHLRSQRNEAAATAAANAGVSGLSGWLLTHELKGKPINKPAAAVTGASALAAGYGALQSGRVARRRNASMNRIELKAKARAEAGLYGPGRGIGPADQTSRNYRRHEGAAR